MTTKAIPGSSSRGFVMMLLAALPLLVSCRRELVVEKTFLTMLPADYVVGSLTFSEDGTAYALVTGPIEAQRVVGTHGTSEPHSACTRLSFAPHSQRLFYWTRDDVSGGKLFTLVADGKPIPTDFMAPGEVHFTADGSHWMAIGARPTATLGEIGEISLIVDGVEVVRQDSMSLPVFSPDGAHVAYLAAKDGRVGLFVDGAERQGFGAPAAPCGMAALQAAPRPDLPLRHVVQYLGDGSLLVMTRDADGWGVYLDGVRVASYPVANIDISDPNCATAAVLAPRSFRKAEHGPFGFWWERIAGDADLWRVVRNGQPIDDVTCSQPWRTQPPEPSDDGLHVVYACALRKADDSTEVFLVKDGKRYGPYQEVWGISIAKNGAHMAYGATVVGGERPWSLYVDGEARVERFTSVWRPRLTDDGAILAWEGLPDPEGRGTFGLGDRRIGSFDKILWGPELLPDERVAWIFQRGRKLTRVSVPLALAAAARTDPVRVVTGTKP